MVQLGVVLEAIHESARRIRTIRATGSSSDGDWRVWWAGPQQVRSERKRDDGLRVSVQAGSGWWILEPNGEAHTNDGEENLLMGFGEELAMLRARSLLDSARLSVVREDEVAGRTAAVLRVALRDGSSWWGDSLDPFEVAVDMERGVILRRPETEIVEIAFDEDLPKDLFSRPYLKGAARERGSPEPPLQVAFEEARNLVSFPVKLPAILPEQARRTVCTLDPDDPPGWVGVSWTVDPGNRFHLHMRQGPKVAGEPPEGKAEERDGATIWIQEWGDGAFRSSTVRIDREGEAAELSSDLPLETIVGIAMSVRW